MREQDEGPHSYLKYLGKGLLTSRNSYNFHILTNIRMMRAFDEHHSSTTNIPRFKNHKF